MTPSIAPLRKHLTDLEEWHRMGESGIFPPGSRLELINGEIVEMSPIGSNHAGHLNRLNQLLIPLIEHQAVASLRNPLQLGDFSEPEPDLMLLKPNPDFYCSGRPQAGDVLLLVEIADSSLEYDRTHKLKLYAVHNIQEYWLLNLNDCCLEVYRRPRGETYDEKITLRHGDTVNLSLLPDIAIQVGSIL